MVQVIVKSIDKLQKEKNITEFICTLVALISFIVGMIFSAKGYTYAMAIAFCIILVVSIVEKIINHKTDSNKFKFLVFVTVIWITFVL